MTEKLLFGTVKGHREHIVDNTGRLYSDGEVADLLNEFNDKNEQLKDKYNEQSVEYEGLEEQVERLLDFRDNVFDLINKKIDKLNNINEVSLIPRESVEILKELKKELQE